MEWAAVRRRKEELAVQCLLVTDGTVWTGFLNSEQKGAGEMLGVPFSLKALSIGEGESPVVAPS